MRLDARRGAAAWLLLAGLVLTVAAGRPSALNEDGGFEIVMGQEDSSPMATASVPEVPTLPRSPLRLKRMRAQAALAHLASEPLPTLQEGELLEDGKTRRPLRRRHAIARAQAAQEAAAMTSTPQTAGAPATTTADIPVVASAPAAPAASTVVTQAPAAAETPKAAASAPASTEAAQPEAAKPEAAKPAATEVPASTEADKPQVAKAQADKEAEASKESDAAEDAAAMEPQAAEDAGSDVEGDADGDMLPAINHGAKANDKQRKKSKLVTLDGEPVTAKEVKEAKVQESILKAISSAVNQTKSAVQDKAPPRQRAVLRTVNGALDKASGAFEAAEEELAVITGAKRRPSRVSLHNKGAHKSHYSTKYACGSALLVQHRATLSLYKGDVMSVTTLAGSCAVAGLATLGGGCSVECDSPKDLTHVTLLAQQSYAAPAEHTCEDDSDAPVLCKYSALDKLAGRCRVVLNLACCDDTRAKGVDDDELSSDLAEGITEQVDRVTKKHSYGGQKDGKDYGKHDKKHIDGKHKAVEVASLADEAGELQDEQDGMMVLASDEAAVAAAADGEPSGDAEEQEQEPEAEQEEASAEESAAA